MPELGFSFKTRTRAGAQAVLHEVAGRRRPAQLSGRQVALVVGAIALVVGAWALWAVIA